MGLAETLRAAEMVKWARVPEKALAWAEQCAPVALDARVLAERFPRQLVTVRVWPESRQAEVYVTKQADVASWQRETDAWPYLVKVSAEPPPPMDASNPPVTAASRSHEAMMAAGQPPYSPWLRNILRWTGFASDAPGSIPFWPSPVAAMLATGLLGGGLGYGAGVLGSFLAPAHWDRKRMRRNWGLLGALAGITPGAIWAIHNLSHGKSILDGFPLNTPPVGAPGGPPEVQMQEKPLDLHTKKGMSLLDGLEKQAVLNDLEESYWWTGASRPRINVPEFQRTVWRDPFVAGPLSPQEQALATGLVGSAAALAGGSQPAKTITPVDIAKVTAGMGTGYLSGLLAGKVIGALTGMPEKDQDMFKQTGMWAGALSKILPIAFGQPA